MKQEIKIEEIHSIVLGILLNENKKDKSFRFVLRRTNRYNRLSLGYWFYGNEKYVALSFWAGMDWKNRTPSVSFIINKLGECSIEFNASDESEKYQFFTNTFLKRIKGLKSLNNGRTLRKEYKHSSYQEGLRSFLSTDKKIIDAYLDPDIEDHFGRDSYHGLGRIIESDFQKMLSKVISYRKKTRERELTDKPTYLNHLKVKGYGSIKDINIGPLNSSTRWVFLTGENGTGKSNILKSIAYIITNQSEFMSPDDIATPKIEAFFHQEKPSLFKVTKGWKNEKDSDESVSISGFASYGPSRLQHINFQDANDETTLDNLDSNLTYNLFNNDGELITYEALLNSSFYSEHKDILQFTENMNEALLQSIPSLSKIDYDLDDDDRFVVFYTEKYEDDELEYGLTSDLLATGAKSILGILIDMMTRLFLQQRHINDPAELTGIVLIDEIDLHLHPRLQKDIVKTLADTFPKIQFIVTTHSPIPLLGAPENSLFYIVKRSKDKGTYVEKINNLHIKQLTPNTILTSPVFGMQNILHHETEEKGLFSGVRSEDNWNDIVIHDKELSSLVKKYKNRINTSNDKSE
jgi:AAA15 family ATPase/GTPase